MTIWFIADTHFGEQPKMRQRLSGMDATALDALLMERWRATVAQETWSGTWRMSVVTGSGLPICPAPST